MVAIGSKDMTTKIYPLKWMTNFHIVTLGGHKDVIAGAFFEKDSLDVYTVSRFAFTFFALFLLMEIKIEKEVTQFSHEMHYSSDYI